MGRQQSAAAKQPMQGCTLRVIQPIQNIFALHNCLPCFLYLPAMKNILSVILFCLSVFFARAQDVKLFHEPKERGFILYATNTELYPVSVTIELNLTNLLFSEINKPVFILPPKTEKLKLGELNVDKPSGRVAFSFRYLTTLGDVTIKLADSSVVYDLPFRKGESFRVYQGYNGMFSHQNENSIDFSMPEGTDIVAAREGVVVQIVQNNTLHCPLKECEKYNNYITIMHADGSYARYVHLQYNSARVKAGDTVQRGDVLALSGNVGWSSGPHLHFVCFTGAFNKLNTLETRFKLDNGNTSALLKEGTMYTRNY